MALPVFLKRNAVLLAVIFALVTIWALWITVFPGWAQRVRADPLSQPVRLVAGTVVEEEVEILAPERYLLSLEVPVSADVSAEELDSLIGVISDRLSGVPVSVRWAVRDADTGVLVAGGDTSVAGGEWRGAGNKSRLVALMRVPAPGRYAVRVEILSGSPALQPLHARAVLHLDPKADTSWQIALVWLAKPVALFVVLPGLVLALVLLANRAVLHRRSSP